MGHQIKSMLEDDRKIFSVWEYGGEEPSFWTIDQGYEFEVYEEAGEMAFVPWIAIKRAGEIVYRIAARHLGIKYVEASS